MHPLVEKIMARHTTNGRLAIAANLLFDLVLVGWVAFTGLYALEVLLPTFVIARISLVKLAVILLLLTTLLIWLGSILEVKREASTKKSSISHGFLIAIVAVSISVVALAHYRFPWWSIPLLLAGYTLTLWLFVREKWQR